MSQKEITEEVFFERVWNCIQEMKIPKQYAPRRITRKWRSLETNEEKREYFIKRIKSPIIAESGFMKLIENKKPEKTLEGFFLLQEESQQLFGTDLMKISANKLNDSLIGRKFLEENSLTHLI